MLKGKSLIRKVSTRVVNVGNTSLTNGNKILDTAHKDYSSSLANRTSFSDLTSFFSLSPSWSSLQSSPSLGMFSSRISSMKRGMKVKSNSFTHHMVNRSNYVTKQETNERKKSPRNEKYSKNKAGNKEETVNKKKKSILIYGCSLEGLCAATALKKYGGTDLYDIEIINSNYQDKNEGKVVVCGPKMKDMLEELGIWDNEHFYHQKFFPVQYFTLSSAKGNRYKTIEFDHKNNAGNFFTIEKKHLVKMLLKHHGKEISATHNELKQLPNGRYTVTDKSSFFSQKQYDLVIGADGIQSKLYQQFFPKQQKEKQQKVDQSSNVGYCSIVIDCPESLEYEHHSFEWWSPVNFSVRNCRGARIGVMPLSDGKLYCYLFLKPDTSTPKQGPSSLLALNTFKSCTQNVKGHGIEQISETIRSHLGQLQKGILFSDGSYMFNDKILLDKCYREDDHSMVLIGESAHYINPSLWQNSTIAVEDGYLLGKLLSEFSNDIPHALNLFNAERLENIKELDRHATKFSNMHSRNYKFRWVFTLNMAFQTLKIYSRLSRGFQ